FKVKGRDLETEVKIRPEQAVLGDKIPVPTLDGEVLVKVPPGSKAGTRLRLKGKGLPSPTGERGDLYVRLVIDIPESLSPEERDLYRKLQDQRRGRVGL
ncbi:MAG TPA: J domain-containing protein, partial [Moorella mulderi]|nr:J domain-containing protein [Moorella mulderi]